MISLDYSKAEGFVSAKEIADFEDEVNAAVKTLDMKNGLGSDFLGWVSLPLDYDKDEFDRIKKAAAKINSDSEVLVVVGIVLLFIVLTLIYLKVMLLCVQPKE